MTARELYILLSDKCNFACAHCINSSGPKATRWMITAGEISAIADEINSNSEFSHIHFSGGEPTLFLREIKEFQSKIKKSVKYTITTNGSFWKDPRSVTEQIKVDEFILSFDRFRAPFIEKENLVKLGVALKEMGHKVVVNLVLVKAEDLAEAFDFSSNGLELIVNGAIDSGRYDSKKSEDNYSDVACLERTCPSVSTTLKIRGAEKINFIPSTGYTPCCGPLVFDNMVDNSFSFSKNISDYENNELRTQLVGKSFKDQAAALGYDLSGIGLDSACAACALLYGNTQAIPSLFTLSKKKEKHQFFPVVRTIEKHQEAVLQQRYNIGYVLTSTKERLEKQVKNLPNENQISEVEITLDNLNEAVQFIKKNYYSKFVNYFSDSDIKKFEESSLSYYSMGIVGRLFKKNNQVVGCFMANYFDQHALLEIPTVHIGYSGYEIAKLSAVEAEAIKNRWVSLMISMHKNGYIYDATIYSFNKLGLGFSKKLGFSLAGIRLDSKDE